MTPVKIGHKILSRSRSVVATALALWCAGAGCMMVSYAHGEAMSKGITKTEISAAGWGQTSGSAGAHDCCKARHASQRRTASTIKSATANFEGLSEVPNPSDTMSCCPLTSGTFVVSGRQTAGNEDALALQGDRTYPPLHDVSVRFHLPTLRLPNQDQTYLRDCVFLI